MFSPLSATTLPTKKKCLALRDRVSTVTVKRLVFCMFTIAS